LDCGVIVTTPVGEVVPTFAVRSSLFAVNEIVLEAVIAPPTERFVNAPVENRLVEPEVLIEPLVEIVWHAILRLEPVEMVPDTLFVKVPELQVTVIPDNPPTAAFTVTLPPVEVKVNELEEFGEVTGFETVIVPELCKMALAEPI
jgi:hypothetical protein